MSELIQVIHYSPSVLLRNVQRLQTIFRRCLHLAQNETENKTKQKEESMETSLSATRFRGGETAEESDPEAADLLLSCSISDTTASSNLLTS